MKSKKNDNFLQELYSVIEKRAKGKDKKSYTKSLIKKGKNKIAEKVAEESTELIIDYLRGTKKRVVEEASDLIYHLLVMLYSKKINLNDIKKELSKRKNVRR
jgi:phosphoribosyl-ATP pyrophosphohydrolase|tara:strand:- start:1334 stop:1639 length:306 start_codon:yes stop_codon:yes gene_type:complete